MKKLLLVCVLSALPIITVNAQLETKVVPRINGSTDVYQWDNETGYSASLHYEPGETVVIPDSELDASEETNQQLRKSGIDDALSDWQKSHEVINPDTTPVQEQAKPKKKKNKILDFFGL